MDFVEMVIAGADAITFPKTDNWFLNLITIIATIILSGSFFRLLDWYRNGRKVKLEEARSIADDQTRILIEPMRLRMVEQDKKIENLEKQNEDIRRSQLVFRVYIQDTQRWYYQNHPDSKLIFPAPPTEVL